MVLKTAHSVKPEAMLLTLCCSLADRIVLCFLCTDLTAAEAHQLLMLLHEWDLAGTGRHSLTDIYICLQLLTLVRVPAGALSGQGAAAASGLALPDRPDSRQSNATTSSLTTSTSVAGRVLAGAAAAVGGAGSGGGLPQQKRQQNKRGAIGAAWEGLQGPGGNNGGSKAGLSLKEAYLKERVAALEAELTHARSGSGAVHTKEVSSGCRCGHSEGLYPDSSFSQHSSTGSWGVIGTSCGAAQRQRFAGG